jgi:hypothetical protein
MRQMRIDFLGVILLLTAAVSAFTATIMAETAPQTLLPQLMANRFGKLSLAEERLAKGETADCITDLSADDRIIRGDLLSWLCTDPSASAQLTYRGISIVGAEIQGKVDLEWARISFPIGAFECVFKDAIILSRSHITSLSLGRSSVTDLEADSTHFEGSVYLRNGFKAERGVNLVGAKNRRRSHV